LEDRAADADITHVVRLQTTLRDLADIVRLAERPPLKLYHRHCTIARPGRCQLDPTPIPTAALPRHLPIGVSRLEIEDEGV
jgi:hypothetical protein